MKRILWLTLALAVLLSLCCAAAQADGEVTYYDLWLGGIQVTSENMNDVTGPDLIGSAQFDPATNTLHLDRFAMRDRENNSCLIYTTLPDLTITGTTRNYHVYDVIRSENGTVRLNGTFVFNPLHCVVTAKTVIFEAGTFTLLGGYLVHADEVNFLSGTYEIESTESSAIEAGDVVFASGTYTFSGPHERCITADSVTFTSGVFDLVSHYAPIQAGTVTIGDAVTSISLTSPLGYDILCDIGSLIIEGVDNCVRSSSTSDHILIAPSLHDMWLGSTEVTRFNRQDIFGDGKASIDPRTYVLTLNDPVIPGVHTDENGVTSKIFASEDLTVTGSYKMSGADGAAFGVYVPGHQLALSGDLLLAGTEAGASAAGLTVKEDAVSAELRGGQAGFLTDSEPVMEGTTGYAQPLNGRAAESGGRWVPVDEVGAVAAAARFMPGYHPYPLWLGKRQVTAHNRTDILGNGKAAYDPAAHTLTLNSPSVPGIHTDENGFSAKIYALGDLAVTGSYRMSAAEAQYGILTVGGDLSLNGDLTLRGTLTAAYCSIDPTAALDDLAVYVMEYHDDRYLYHEPPHGNALLAGNITLIGDQYGLLAHDTAELKSGSITIEGGVCGVFTIRDLLITGGNIDISGGETGVESYVGAFEIRAGRAEITAQTKNGLTLHSQDLSVLGGELVVTCVQGYDAIHVTGDGDVHINGGSVTAVSHKWDESGRRLQRGVSCRGLYISGAAQRVELEGETCAKISSLQIENGNGQYVAMVEPGSAVLHPEYNYFYEPGVPEPVQRMVFEHAYPLLLGSTLVGSWNRADIFGDGKAGFDPATNVLTLNSPDITGYVTWDGNRAKIFADGIPLTLRGSYAMPADQELEYGLVSAQGPLTLDGAFTLRGTISGIYADGDVTVAGGTVNALSGDHTAVRINNGDLILSGGSLNAISGDTGVGLDRGRLIIHPGIDKACFEGTAYAAIAAKGGITLTENSAGRVRLVAPSRGYLSGFTVYDPDYIPVTVGTVYIPASGSTFPARTVRFESERLYDIFVGGVEVSSSNAQDVLGDGTVSYDPSRMTLTLNEPTITASVTDDSSGFEASGAILFGSSYRDLTPTLKGSWHMDAPCADFAVQSAGHLALDGSFALKGTIAGVLARQDLVARSGSANISGGEVGVFAERLLMEASYGYMEAESGCDEPIVLKDECILPAGYRIRQSFVDFRTEPAVDTPHFKYAANTVVTVRKFDALGTLTGNKYKPVSSVRISDIGDFEGAGSAGDPYQIATAEDWDRLAELIEDEDLDLSLKYFCLTNDLTVTRMISSSDHPFSGCFDGRGYTLTFNFTTDEQRCAPFRYVGAAVFRNLRLAGTIHTGAKFAAGLTAYVGESCNITNCASAVNIVSSVSGDGTHGGFVASGSNITIIGSVFTGSITGTDTTLCAGFIGWDSGGSRVRHCIFNGSIPIGSGAATFIRNVKTADNCYYVEPIGMDRDWGKQMHTVSSSMPSAITIDFGGGVNYDVSGITAYPGGLSWLNYFWAGKGDTVSMRLNYGSPLGYRVAGPLVNAGTLTQGEDDLWLLTMPDEDVFIRPILVPPNGSGTEEDPWQLSDTCLPDDLYTGWYRVERTCANGDALFVHGEVRLVLREGTALTASGGIVVPADGSLAVLGAGTLTASGANGGPAIGGGGPVTFAEGLAVTPGGAQDPVRAEDRAAACAQSSVTVAPCGHGGAAFVGGVIACPWCGHPLPVSGTGTADDPFLIRSADDWDLFASAIENGFDTVGRHFALAAQISVSSMFGTQANPFAGTFNGRTRTLTFNAENTVDSKPTAPFAYTSGATIRNLRTAGAITGSKHRASGLIGENYAVSQVVNCRVAMSLSGKYYVAGFCLGEGEGVRLTGCLFSGSVTATGKSALFVAWANPGSALSFTNCLAAPSSVSWKGTCGTFYYDDAGTAEPTLVNTLYLTRFGAAQGAQAYSVAAADGLTADFGSPRSSYVASGLQAYASGLVYRNTFYAAEGAQVRLDLTLSDAVPEGSFLAGFAAAGSALTQSGTAWKLTMPAADVTVSPLVFPAFGTSAWLTLPAAMTAVRADAFEGIAARAVQLPPACAQLGDHAFRSCPNLTAVRVPAGCAFGEDVFDGCPLVCVFGIPGSPAEAYCAAHANCIFLRDPGN